MQLKLYKSLHSSDIKIKFPNLGYGPDEPNTKRTKLSDHPETSAHETDHAENVPTFTAESDTAAEDVPKSIARREKEHQADKDKAAQEADDSSKSGPSWKTVHELRAELKRKELEIAEKEKQLSGNEPTDNVSNIKNIYYNVH